MQLFAVMSRKLIEAFKAASSIAEGRKLEGIYQYIFRLIAIAFGTLFLYIAGPPFLGLVPPQWARGLFITMITVLVFMKFPFNSKSPKNRISILDLVFILLTLIVFGYWILYFKELIQRTGNPTDLDVIFGLLAIIICLESTRRVMGYVLTGLATIFLLYAYLGPYMPAALSHGGYSISEIAYKMFSQAGIFGIVLSITMTYVALFILFGALLGRFGAGQFFVEFPYALTGRLRGGPAKAAVIASGFLGMISGSATANTVATGAFTIPLMKKAGYRPHEAAATEAAASTGGMFMPPVMGAAVFLMAEILGTPYIELVKIGLAPALIYFFSVIVMTHLQAQKNDIRPFSKEEQPDTWKIFKEGWFYLVPIVFIVVLLVLGYSPSRAVYWAIIIMIVINGAWRLFNKPEGETTTETVKGLGSSLLLGLAEGAENSLVIGSLVGSVGLILGSIFITGLGFIFTGAVFDLTFGYVSLAIVLVFFAAYVLGMGMTVTSAYVLLAVLVAPALVQMGIEPIAAHFLIFWFSQTSNVSPPVALAAFAGAGIANADPNKTGFTALKYASFLIILPVMFIYTPILMPDGLNFAAARAMATAVLATLSFGAGVIGFFRHRLKFWERGAFLIITLMMLLPQGITDLLGIIALVLMYIYLLKKPSAINE